MARPVGSYCGIRPAGGYPDLSVEDGAFLAGFLDGEASFLIPKHSGPRYACTCTVSLRRDDAPLLESLSALTGLGRLNWTPAGRVGHPQARWSITRKADCARLREILIEHPLRSRKLADALTWIVAVEDWVGDDASDLPRNRDWSGMAFLSRKIKSDRRYSPKIGFRCATRVSPGTSSYLAGLISAEGHLGIFKQAGGTFGVRAVVAMRADDLPLLQEMRSTFQIGTVRIAERPGANPSAIWAVHSFDDRRRLVDILDQHPPRGRKGDDYAIWRLAALERRSSTGRGRLYQRLKDVRRFQG